MGYFDNKSASLLRTLGIAALALSSSQAVLANWTVQGSQLIDRNGQPFVFRGVTIDHTLAPEKTVQAIKDVAATGANAVQIEFPIAFYNGFPREVAAQLKQIVAACKANKLICVLESNDISGYPEGTGSQSPDIYAGSWSWDDFLPVVAGQQDYIIIGLGNQALGNSAPAAEYKSRMYTYLSNLRSSLPGFTVMVDGNLWGQDVDKAMVSLAEETRASGNALQNVIFSIDMFDKYSNPETVRDYIARFKAIGAPLVIGGFAPTAYYHPNYNGSMPLVVPQLPAASVMQYAQEAGVGYFAWSWSGNKNSALDLVSNWNPAQLTTWGDLALNGVNGIKATAKPASIFSSTSSSSSSFSSANLPPVPGFSVSNYPTTFCNGREAVGIINANADATIDPEGDAFSCSWQISGGASTSASACTASFPSQNRMYYQLTLTVTDSKGASAQLTKTVQPFYVDCPSSSSSSSSSIRSSSSIPDASRPSTSSSSVRSSSSSSIRTSSSSSVPQTTKAQCSYVINSQWNNGFTAAIRIKNTTSTAINGWDVNWQYSDGSKVTNLWNATLSGSNPYTAKNLSWNSTIQPGQTVEFGFQGTKSAAVASTPVVTGSICQ